MCINRNLLLGLVAGICSLITSSLCAQETLSVEDRLSQIDALIIMGIQLHGAGRAFNKAEIQIDELQEELDQATAPSAEQQRQRLRLASQRSDLEEMQEVFDQRFFGAFPLVRLMSVPLMGNDGFALTEQLFYENDEAATISAGRSVAQLIEGFDHPHVVINSQPQSRLRENLVTEALIWGKSTSFHTRQQLLAALDDDQLQSFDAGIITTEIVETLSQELGAVTLVVLTITEMARLDDGLVIGISGRVYMPGIAIQGSPADASPAVLISTFSFRGQALDRRDQLFNFRLLSLGILILVLVWATRVKWSVGDPLTMTRRLLIGLALFVAGRLIMVLVLYFLRQVLPEQTALVTAALWWPGVIGFMCIVGAGFMVWLLQAKLTNIIPGSRNARAIGSVFALTSLGATSSLILPVLLLDEGHGLAYLFPFTIAATTSALLFGVAVRSGPPVPRYFMWLPLLLSPLIGMALFSTSVMANLAVAGGALLACLAAWLRNRLADRFGWKTDNLSDEEAAQIDQERMLKIQEKLSHK